MARLVNFIDDLEGTFFQCNICLDTLKEPRQLPCFHRFCKNCLIQVCRVTSHDVIKCPVCRKSVSKEAIKAQKTDHLMKHLIHYCNERKRAEVTTRIRQCHGCMGEEWVHLYCFACYAFFCQSCSQSHCMSGPAKDHMEFVLHIDNYPEVSDEGLQKLDCLWSARRCRNHPELAIQAVCTTCQNVGICIVCASVGHKDHSLESLDWVTSGLIEKLKCKADDMEIKKEEFLRHVNRAKDICRNVKVAATSLIGEIQDNDITYCEAGSSSEYEVTNSASKEHNIDVQKCSIIAYLRDLELSQSKRITQLQDDFTNWKQRSAELNLAADYLISSSNELAFPKAISAMCDIIGDIVQQGKRSFEDTSQTSYAQLVFSPSKSADCLGVVHVKASLESKVKIKLMGNADGCICSITTSKDGRLILGLYTDNGTSEIVEAAIDGEVIRRHQFVGTTKRPRRVVTSLVGSRVVSACYRSEIGVFDTSDRSYVKVSLDELKKNWPPDNWVTCLAVDHTRGQILVGSVLQSKENIVKGIPTLEVLTYDLEYSHTLTLPCPMKGPTDICVVGDKIVVCDLWGRNVYAIDMQGRLLCKFLCPRVNNYPCAPRNVCTDFNGYVYILWECNISNKMHKLIMQSTIEGCPVTLRQVDNDAKCLTVVRTRSGELKLVVATYTSKQLHVYSMFDFHFSQQREVSK